MELRNQRKTDKTFVSKVTSQKELFKMQKEVENIHISKIIERYIVEIVGNTRTNPNVEVGASPRGSLAIFKLSKAKAWLDGRSYVIPDDVKDVSVSALSHRLILKPEQWLRGGRTIEVIEEILQKIPVPKVD